MLKRGLVPSSFNSPHALFVHAVFFLIKAALQSCLNMPLCGVLGSLIAPQGKDKLGSAWIRKERLPRWAHIFETQLSRRLRLIGEGYLLSNTHPGTAQLGAADCVLTWGLKWMNWRKLQLCIQHYVLENHRKVFISFSLKWQGTKLDTRATGN